MSYNSSRNTRCNEPMPPNIPLTSGGLAGCTSHIGDIDLAMKDLADEIENVTHKVDELVVRLAPVLSPAPKVDDGVIARDSQSPLSELIRHYTNNIFCTRRIIDDLLTRLQLS